MAGFAKSFEDAYTKSAAISQAGTLDAIKEKIKANADQRDAGLVLDSLEAKITESASKSGKSPEDIATISKSLDALRKAKLTASEAMAMGKMVAPEAFVDESVVEQRKNTQAIKDSNLEMRRQTVENTQANRQDKLEKYYADRLTKVLSNRTGGLGLQDNKVNTAIDLRTMVDGMQDPTTGEYKIPPSAHTELALGLAKLLSPTGVVPIALTQGLEQGTLKQKISNVAIFFGADPNQVGGTTQSVARYMIKAIDRQGKTAETIRDKYITGLKQTAPKGLSQDVIDNLNKVEMTSSFNDYVKTKPGIKEFDTEEEALKSGYKGIAYVAGKRASLD